MSSFKEREVVESKDLRPIQSGIGSLLESNRILSIGDIPTQAEALGYGTARSFVPGVAGWVGSRVGGLASGLATGNPYMAAAAGFVGSTAGGGLASSGAQYLQNLVAPVGAKELLAMNRFPITTQGGGYLSMIPFLRGSSLSEWSRDPVGRLKNTGGEVAGEFLGSAAISAATGNLRNFNIVDESIGAAIESVLQNEETRLGNFVARGIGLQGSTVPPNATVRPTVGGTAGTQRSLVAEAIAGTPAAPAAPATTTIPTATPAAAAPVAPPVAGVATPQPPVVAPGAPAAATPITPATPVAPVAPVQTVPPAAPAAATGVPPSAPLGTVDTTNIPIEQEELLPVQPRPTDSPDRQKIWDDLYGETHTPNGRPITFAEPRPAVYLDRRNDPSYKPEFDNPDRGTGNMPISPRPRIIPESVARVNMPDIMDSNTPEEAMKRVEEEAAKNPNVAEYVKNNKVAIDQAIQAHIAWNKKNLSLYHPTGNPKASQQEADINKKYNTDLNPEYAADLKRRQEEWDAKNASDFEATGWPKDNRTATAKFREGKTLRRKNFYRKMVGPEGKRDVAWFSEDKDVILPGTVNGRRVYRVGLNGTDSMIGGMVNPTAPAMITESLDEAIAFIEKHRVAQAASQAERDAREKEAREAEKQAQDQAQARAQAQAQAEAEAQAQNKPDEPAKDTSTPAQPTAPQATQPAADTADIDRIALERIFSKVPEYKWASPVGDAYSNFRMEVMKALGAQGVTKANSGVNNYRKLIIDKFGIDQNQTIAAIDKDIVKFLKQLFKGSSGGMDDQSGPGADTQATTTTKPKGTKPAGAAQAAQATITKPITDEEKSKLKDLNFDDIRQENEDAEDDDADVNDPFHAIFTDIAERNGYMDKAEMKAYLEGVFGAKEFSDTDASKALAKWTPAPKPVQWDGKKTAIAGTGHSLAVIPNSQPRQKNTGYSGRHRSAVVILDKDGTPVLISPINEWKNRYSGAEMIGPYNFSERREEFNGMKPKYGSFEEMVEDMGKEEALKVYDEFIKAQIAEMRKLAKDLKFNPKNDEPAVRLHLERFNLNALDIESGRTRMDPLNEILGLTGKETDSEFAEAVEKRYGVTFVSADRGYVSGWNKSEKFRRHYEFSFNINAPGLPKPKRADNWMFNLNNHDWIQAVKYEALAGRIKDPSKEASDLRKKIPDLAYEGSARKKAEARLEALNEAYAKKVLEGMKVYSPEDSRYVKGSVIPDYFPGQKDMTFNEGEIEELATIYRPDPIEIIADTNPSEKAPENAKANLAFIENNDRELYTMLQEHSIIAGQIKKISESLQKGESDDIDADIAKHAELTRKILKTKLDIVIQVNKLEKEYEADLKAAGEQQSRADKKFPVGKDSYISFDTAATKEAKNIEMDEESNKSINEINKEIRDLVDQRNDLDEDDPKDKDAIKLLDSKLEDARNRKNKISAIKKKTVNATITSEDGQAQGSVRIDIGQSFPDYAREEYRDVDQGESSTGVKIEVDWKSVSQDELNDIVENVVTRLLSMRVETPTRLHENLTEVVSFSLDGLDENSVKMLKKAVSEIESKDKSFEKSTYSKSLKEGNAILFSLEDSKVGSLSNDGMSKELIEYSELDKESNQWTREAIRNLIVESESNVPFDQRTKKNIEDLIDELEANGEHADIEKLKINQIVEKALKRIGPESYKGLKELVQDMKDFKSGKMFGDKGAQQEAKPTKPAKPAEPADQAPATPAQDSVTAIAQEKEGDTASLKAARTKLRSVIKKLGSDSQQAQAMAKNIQRAEEKQASFNRAADNSKPYGTTPEPEGVTKARAIMAQQLKKGTPRSIPARKASEIIDQYEVEYDLFTGQATEEGIQRVSNRALEAFLQQAQDAIDAAGGMSEAGNTLKPELGTAFSMAQKEFKRRQDQQDRKDDYGDILADIESIVKGSKGSIAIPTLPKALGSSWGEMSEMFDKGLTTGSNSILRQPMFGIDVERYKTDKDYKKEVNNRAEGMMSDLVERLAGMGWTQLDPSKVSSDALIDLLYEAGMGRPLVPQGGVLGANWKGEVGMVQDVAKTDLNQLPDDLFKQTKKPQQLGGKPKDDLFDTSDTFNLSGETVSAPAQTQAQDTTQDLAPETQEPAYVSQARAQLAKLEKSGKNLEQQRTLRDTIEKYEATQKNAQPEPEAAQQAVQPMSQELKDQFDNLLTEAESTMDDLQSTAGGTAASDKEVNGKNGIIAMAREAIEKASLMDGSVPRQDAIDMLRAASTRAVEILESHQEKASNIEDMGREDPFAEREDMIDQLQDLANQLDIFADIIEEAAGAQAVEGQASSKRSDKQIMDEINALRAERNKEIDAILGSKLDLAETEEAIAAVNKKYDPQFKKLNADFKAATKNSPGGTLGIERSIELDMDKANTILKYKKKLDAGIINQAQYDEMEAIVLGKSEESKSAIASAINGSDIASPLPESITNQKDKDAVAQAIINEMTNQFEVANHEYEKNRETTTSFGSRPDIKSIKGAESFVVSEIKKFLDKNPNASYLEVVAHLKSVSTPNSRSFKGKLSDAQNLYAKLTEVYRNAVGNLRLAQIASGMPESEVISGDTRNSLSDEVSGYHVMNEIGVFESIQRYLNMADAPYVGGEGWADFKKGKPRDDKDELLGNTAFKMLRQFNESVSKLINTGKYTTTTTLLDAAIADLEKQVKQLDTYIQNEILTKIKAYAESRKGDQPFSRRDRIKGDSDKARELERRVNRNATNRQGDPDARKGFSGMISRVLDELRLRGEITAKEAEGLTRIMNYVGSVFFRGEKMSIKNDNERGYYGMYSFGEKVLTIFRDAMRDGRFEYTAAHEIAHLLTKYLPDKDRKDLINEWRSARMKFLKQNPGIAAVLPLDPYADLNSTHFSSLDVQKAESIQPGASKMFIRKDMQVGLRGKTKTVYVMAATDDVYQIFNADEFFAENFAKTVIKRLNTDPVYTGNPNTWRDKLASLWDMIKTSFRQMFGKDVAARILSDFAKAKITPDMKGNYGLQDLHYHIPSKGDKVDLATWNTRHGQDALTVTEQSEKELIENVRKSLDKSMTIKDAMHMILRGTKGGKMGLMKLLTSKYNREYEVQFSSKSYEQLYGSTLKTSEGRPFKPKRVRGAHFASGQYIRLFPEDILASSKKYGISFADALAYVLTHEVIHSYTLDAVKENSVMRKQAADLVKEIRSELSLTMTEAEIDNRFYGLSSPAELLTECLIDSELRDIANSIKTKTKRLSELYGDTLLEKIVSLFQNALESIGIKVNRDSVLERVTEMIAIGREDADAIKKGTQFMGAYTLRDEFRQRGNFKSTWSYSYSPDSPTAVSRKAALARDKAMTEKNVASLMERARKAREDGYEEEADMYERHAANMQRMHDEHAKRVADELNGGAMPMLEQAIPDLKKIDGNDTPSARETLLGIRDDVMPSIGPANRQPVRKTEKKTITQIAWDVVSGRYFSGLSAKAHQNAERHSYSETVKAVANMIHSRPGVNSNSTERDIPTAIMTSRIRFQNKFNTIMDPLKDMLAGFKDTASGTAQEQREIVYRALHDMIRGEKPITKGKLGEVASKLKDLFVELRDYRTQAGEKLGDIEDYFPAVYDSPRISTERQGFVKDATEAYRLTIQKVGDSAKYVNELSRMSSAQLAKELKVSKDEVEAGVTKNGTDIDDLIQQRAIEKANAALAKELGITKEEVENGGTEDGKSIDQLIAESASARANELFETHLRGMGSSEFDSIFGSQTGTDQENTNLSRVFTGDAQKVMAKWQVADPFRVVSSYIMSSAKKAEMVRKFGAEGEVWKGYAEQMEADGVPYETISEMRELLRVAAGYGIPSKGKAAQTYVDSITMMTAASAMGRGFLNNLVEPVTMGIRAGNPIAAARGLIETWGRFAREVARLSPAIKAKLGETFWAEYGKEIGTIHSSIEDAWMATHSMDLDADRADPRFRWITNRIYQANLMDASEVAKQQASHAIGYSYILGLAKLKKGKSWMNKLGMDPSQSTKDQLNELGVPESEHAQFADFVMGLEGLNDVDRMKAMTENSDMAKLHQEAMVRFSYQSSVRSNRAHKPIFQDDLFGKTVLQLMNFSYSFAAEVNSRLFSMTKQAFTPSPEGKNYNLSDRARMAAPLLSGFLSIVAYKMLFSMKDELYPTEGTERRKRDPELLKWINATSYAGFLGPKAEQLIKIVKRDQAPGGPVGQSLVNVARATTTAVESAVEGKDMGGAKRQAAKASVPIIKGAAVAGASAINPLLGAATTQITNTTGWANELTKDETKGSGGVGDALFAKPVNPRKPGK